MTNQKTFSRIMPVVLALSPIGILFGILAGQADWSFLDVFFMSLIGFTGSGQFTYLGFAHPDNGHIEYFNGHIEYFTVFLIILGINLRYIPMSLSASSSISGSIFIKTVLSHWLADESYAVERKEDSTKEKMIIRISVVVFWTLSTSCGVLLSGVLPVTAKELLTGLTFPISAILILLSLDNIFAFVDERRVKPIFNYRKLCAVAVCIGISVLCIVLIGRKYFWLPSIAVSYLILCRYAGTRVEA